MTDERTRLREAQAKAVMPLIGPLLDAYEALPNDIRCLPELDDLMEALAFIDMGIREAS